MIKICAICGKEFEQGGTTAKYCSKECQLKGKVEATRKRRNADRKIKKAAEERAKKHSARSKRIAKICREQGISYGQAQAQETLKMLKEGRL